LIPKVACISGGRKDLGLTNLSTSLSDSIFKQASPGIRTINLCDDLVPRLIIHRFFLLELPKVNDNLTFGNLYLEKEKGKDLADWRFLCCAMMYI